MRRQPVIIFLLVSSLIPLILTNNTFAQENWDEVVRFNGNEEIPSRITELITCESSEWRIKIIYVPSIHAHHFVDMFDFCITIYPEGEDTNYVNQINTDADGWIQHSNGTTPWTNPWSITNYIHNNTGKFYMKIDAIFVDNYTITVEQNLELILGSDGNWVEVTRFNGTIWPEYTERFRIDYFDWRINWSITPKSSDLIIPLKFRLDVRNASGYIVEFFLASFQISGTLNMNQSGEYYLYIDPMYAKNYSITIEQNIQSIPEFQSWIILPVFIVVCLFGIFHRKRGFI